MRGRDLFRAGDAGYGAIFWNGDPDVGDWWNCGGDCGGVGGDFNEAGDDRGNVARRGVCVNDGDFVAGGARDECLVLADVDWLDGGGVSDPIHDDEAGGLRLGSGADLTCGRGWSQKTVPPRWGYCLHN